VVTLIETLYFRENSKGWIEDEEKYTNWETLHNDNFEFNGKEKEDAATKKGDTLKDIMDNRNKDRNKNLSWLLSRRTTQKRGNIYI
jgi:hypothetical protein